MLREDLMKSRQAERLAKQKLMEMTSSSDLFSVSGKQFDVSIYNYQCSKRAGDWVLIAKIDRVPLR